VDTVRAVIKSYDRQSHTATIEVWGAQLTHISAVPVSHQIEWWACTAGTQCALLLFNDTDHLDAVILCTYSGAQPSNPLFDPSLGHRHRGIQDDAPTI